MTTPTKVALDTGDLKYQGILGRAKLIAAAIAGLIESILPFIPIDSRVRSYLHIAVAVLGAIAVYQIPNKLVPTEIVDDSGRLAH